ncbi:helix-turn-helix transcriptional regulator [Erysipelothrix sp. HDW6A]|uniref:helix-turn-helix transcriptional regulator n=1 Tax=Erysipelothrix sp. HDW6A TaxID=2714928 RepID=UPI00351ADE01
MNIKNIKMKKLREQLNLSQLSLSKKVGVSRQTIISVENGDYNPTLELCIKICKELNVTLNDLFWNDEGESI